MDDVSILNEGTIKKMKIKRNQLTLTIIIIVSKKPLLGVHISQKRGSLDEKKNLFWKITNLIIARFRLYVMGTSFISGAAIKRSTCFLLPSFIKTTTPSTAADEVVRITTTTCSAQDTQKRQQERSIYIYYPRETFIWLIFPCSSFHYYDCLIVCCFLIIFSMAFYVHLSSSDTAQTYNAISTLHSRTRLFSKGEIKIIRRRA